MYLLPEEHTFITIYCSHCGDPTPIIQVCENRFCPHCGYIRRWRLRDRLHQVLENFKKVPKYRLKMLTLAEKNCEDLEAGLNHLISSFRRLRQHKFWKRHVLGGLFVIEITGSPGQYHPHLHCFIYSLRIDWAQLLSHWDKASQGGRSVWIANISNDNAIYYVTKYATKAAKDLEFVPDAAAILRKRRLFQRFGTFAKVPITPRRKARQCAVCGCDCYISEFDLRRLDRSGVNVMAGFS